MKSDPCSQVPMPVTARKVPVRSPIDRFTPPVRPFAISRLARTRGPQKPHAEPYREEQWPPLEHWRNEKKMESPTDVESELGSFIRFAEKEIERERMRQRETQSMKQVITSEITGAHTQDIKLLKQS